MTLDNLGLPPLAGLCTYDEAERPGLGVEPTVDRLMRLEYAFRRLHTLSARSIPVSPEWELKCALSLHAWQDAEHCGTIRRRINELRHPSVRFNKSPDPALSTLFDELDRFRGSRELAIGSYGVAGPALLSAILGQRELANPVADYFTVRILDRAILDLEAQIAWGEAAIEALADREPDDGGTEAWRRHLNLLLAKAGGMTGAEERPSDPDPSLRSDDPAPTPDFEPRRDERFVDLFNTSAKIDEYYTDEKRPADERAFALAYKRLREMDVPEWMGPILAAATEQPWEYNEELSRQLWDEARHAMMGEIALNSYGVPFYSFPIPITASTALNTEFSPREAHLLLWGIEQSLMPAKTGKRWEFEVVGLHGDPLLSTFQDFDWADEVVHVKIGRRWLASTYGSREEAQEASEDVWQRWDQSVERLERNSEQRPWWPDFVTQMRQGA